MPLYEYQCTKCAARFERIEKVNGPHLRKCPSCAGRVERMASAPAIQFKGSGWYVTDYGGRGETASGKSESEKSEAADKADKAAKPESKDAAKESKPAPAAGPPQPKKK